MRKLLNLHLIATVLAFGTSLHAGEFSEHFISASAGAVNYIEGRPLVFFGSANSEMKVLEARTQVKAGDFIRTAEQDRLELLLNPGSYLRLGFSSELRVLQTSFEAMHFELVRGSAIVESATFNRKVHALKLSTPSGDVALIKDGLYRFEVQPSRVELAVHKGQAKWSKDGMQVATLKSGKRFVLAVPAAGGEVQFAKLDKQDADELDRWSRRRAEFLVAANMRLAPWLMTSLSDRYAYNLRGGWMFNPYFNCFTFVPFDGSFGSPYGFRYGMFLPVRMYRYGPGYNEPWSTADGGYNSPSARGTSYEQRSTVVSAPAAPAARVETGRSEQEGRSGTFDRIRNQ
ncbi:MAG: FecR family protein [Acidobacteria bacterium]|nr:FecR family protein [Acidobacteriota bacterium]